MRSSTSKLLGRIHQVARFGIHHASVVHQPSNQKIQVESYLDRIKDEENQQHPTAIAALLPTPVNSYYKISQPDSIQTIPVKLRGAQMPNRRTNSKTD